MVFLFCVCIWGGGVQRALKENSGGKFINALQIQWVWIKSRPVTHSYSWFHIKGTWSVHSFNGDYLSIPEGTGSCEYLFMKSPVLKCQINKNTKKKGCMLPTKCLERALKYSYLVSIILNYQFPKTKFADFFVLILDFNSISSHFNSIISSQ